MTRRRWKSLLWFVAAFGCGAEAVYLIAHSTPPQDFYLFVAGTVAIYFCTCMGALEQAGGRGKHKEEE